jgi:hypothetical protein
VKVAVGKQRPRVTFQLENLAESATSEDAMVATRVSKGDVSCVDSSVDAEYELVHRSNKSSGLSHRRQRSCVAAHNDAAAADVDQDADGECVKPVQQFAHRRPRFMRACAAQRAAMELAAEVATSSDGEDAEDETACQHHEGSLGRGSVGSDATPPLAVMEPTFSAQFSEPSEVETNAVRQPQDEHKLIADIAKTDETADTTSPSSCDVVAEDTSSDPDSSFGDHVTEAPRFCHRRQRSSFAFR